MWYLLCGALPTSVYSCRTRSIINIKVLSGGSGPQILLNEFYVLLVTKDDGCTRILLQSEKTLLQSEKGRGFGIFINILEFSLIFELITIFHVLQNIQKHMESIRDFLSKSKIL